MMITRGFLRDEPMPSGPQWLCQRVLTLLLKGWWLISWLVGGLEHDFEFSIQLGMSSSQLNFIFFRGVAQPPAWYPPLIPLVGTWYPHAISVMPVASMGPSISCWAARSVSPVYTTMVEVHVLNRAFAQKSATPSNGSPCSHSCPMKIDQFQARPGIPENQCWPICGHPGYIGTLWVCLKMLCTHLPNGFADHYPNKKWLAISLGIWTQHFQTHPYGKMLGSPFLGQPPRCVFAAPPALHRLRRVADGRGSWHHVPWRWKWAIWGAHEQSWTWKICVGFDRFLSTRSAEIARLWYGTQMGLHVAWRWCRDMSWTYSRGACWKKMISQLTAQLPLMQWCSLQHMMHDAVNFGAVCSQDEPLVRFEANRNCSTAGHLQKSQQWIDVLQEFLQWINAAAPKVGPSSSSRVGHGGTMWNSSNYSIHGRLGFLHNKMRYFFAGQVQEGPCLHVKSPFHLTLKRGSKEFNGQSHAVKNDSEKNYKRSCEGRQRPRSSVFLSSVSAVSVSAVSAVEKKIPNYPKISQAVPTAAVWSA